MAATYYLRKSVSLFLGFLALSSDHAHSQATQATTPRSPNSDRQWIISRYHEPVFGAHLNNNRLTTLDIECRDSQFHEPDITVTLVIREFASGSLNPTGDFIAYVVAGDKTLTLPMKRIGEADGTTEFRYFARGSVAFENMLNLSDAIDSARKLTVSASGGSGGAGTEAFEYAATSGDDVKDVVRHCSPAAVAARHEVEDNRDINALLTLDASANGKCRGGSGDSPATQYACDERTEYEDRLAALGMCYGRPGEFGYQMQWHRCGPTDAK